MIANTSPLRLLAIKRTASSNAADHQTLDLPIVAWDGNPLRPVVVAALDDSYLLRLYDPTQKVWFSLEGQMFGTFAAARAEAWEGGDDFGVGEAPRKSASIAPLRPPLAPHRMHDTPYRDDPERA